MKILVTGATGFLGNYIILRLLQLGHEVLATARTDDKCKKMPWYNEVDYCAHMIGDKLSSEAIELFHEAQLCIHLAWDGLPNYNAPEHQNVQVEKQLLFLNQLIDLGIPKISVTGTCLEYGLLEGEQKESDPTHPTTNYGKGKDQLRQKLEELCLTKSFEFDWIRLYYMYGKGQHPKALLSQLETAITNGESEFNMSKGDQLRDYLPVEKVAEIIVNLALKNKGCGIVNCCSGQPISINELVNRYLKSRGVDLKLNKGYYNYPDYEPHSFWGSTVKLNELLNEKS